MQTVELTQKFNIFRRRKIPGIVDNILKARRSDDGNATGIGVLGGETSTNRLMTPAQGKQGHLINPSFYRCCPTELFDSLKPLTIESHVAHLERLVADLVGQAIAEVENDPATAMRLDDLPTRMPKAVNVRQRNSC